MVTARMDRRNYLLIALLALCACAPKTSQWDNLDYSKIARERYDNDYNYRPPTVAACSDDDLYNCVKGR